MRHGQAAVGSGKIRGEAGEFAVFVAPGNPRGGEQGLRARPQLAVAAGHAAVVTATATAAARRRSRGDGLPSRATAQRTNVCGSLDHQNLFPERFVFLNTMFVLLNVHRQACFAQVAKADELCTSCEAGAELVEGRGKQGLISRPFGLARDEFHACGRPERRFPGLNSGRRGAKQASRADFHS